MISGFTLILNFLAAQTGEQAAAAWPRGPTVGYRRNMSVPVADYIGWIREVERSPALVGENHSWIIQRLRRLYFSDFTEPFKGRTATEADNIMDEVVPDDEAPLTTDHVPLAALNGLFGTGSIRTARNLDVDVAHLWVAADWVVNGGTLTAYPFFDSDPIAVFTWGGDLGSAIRTFRLHREVNRAGANPTAARKSEILLDAVKRLVAKDDLLGDLDAIAIAARWDTLSTFVVSDELEQYYKDDAMPQAQARDLTYANSARRFHYFVKAATPSIPASGTDSAPPEITLDDNAAIAKLETDLVALASDVWGTWKDADNVSELLDTIGRAEFEKLCTRVVVFLKTGLRTGDAPWPPASL